MDAEQLRHLVIQPVLTHLNMPGRAAENILLGTVAQESDMGHFLTQRGNHLADGIFQMEPDTKTDIDRYLGTRRAKEIKERVSHLRMPQIMHYPEDEMVGNLYLATAYARVKYWMIPVALPRGNDLPGLARYYKKYYNTPGGAATEEEFIENYHRYVKIF